MRYVQVKHVCLVLVRWCIGKTFWILTFDWAAQNNWINKSNQSSIEIFKRIGKAELYLISLMVSRGEVNYLYQDSVLVYWWIGNKYLLVIVWSVYKDDFNKATTHVFNYVFLRKWNFEVDYIIENHLAHEEYKQQVYNNMWLSSMIRFYVCDMKGVTEEKNDLSHRSVEIRWSWLKTNIVDGRNEDHMKN